MNITEALDIETAPEYGYPQEFALQPWRVLEGRAKVTVVALGAADGRAYLGTDNFDRILASREGIPTAGWNVMFDIAFLIAAGHYEACNRIPWVDAMLLWKWYENGVLKERVPGWTLVDGAKRWLKDWPLLEQFIALKESEDHTAGVNDRYWQLRGKLDAVATAMIAERIWAKLSDRKRQSAMIEMACLVPMARSWVMGVPMDPEKITEVAPRIDEEMREIEQRIGTTSKVLASPKQLGALLFDQWGLEPIEGHVSEKTGVPSTDKSHLTYLAERDNRVLEILRWRHLNTQKSKFMEAPVKAFDYLSSNVVHPSPFLFSTYTARVTYASKTKKKYPTGVALHQWQRDKEVRSLIGAPPGYKLVEYDASGQEDRLMAECSQDVTLIRLFNEKGDVHCYTAGSITGRGYEEMLRLKKAKDPWVVGDNGMRQAGKFTNHSNKYRIGKKKMRIQAKVQYGMDITLVETGQYQNAFHRSFPGIKRYWGNAIQQAKTLGYASTLAGRTFITPERFFVGDDAWSTESSAINFPIQGSGADMKELAIAEMHKAFPDFLFAFDLHDGLFYYVAEGTPISRLQEAKTFLDNLDYEKHWGYKPTVPMIWDGEFGPDWGHMTSLDDAEQEFL